MRGHLRFVADARAISLLMERLPRRGCCPTYPRCEIVFSVNHSSSSEAFQVRQLYGGDGLAERIGLRGGVFCAISSTSARCGRQKPFEASSICLNSAFVP